MKLKKHQEDKNGDSVKERAGIKGSGTWRELNAGLQWKILVSVTVSLIGVSVQCPYLELPAYQNGSRK